MGHSGCARELLLIGAGLDALGGAWRNHQSISHSIRGLNQTPLPVPVTALNSMDSDLKFTVWAVIHSEAIIPEILCGVSRSTF